MKNSFLVTCFALALLLAGICKSPAESVDIAALSRPALLATGDTARIQRVFARARRGEALTVAVIGGSITAGAMARRDQQLRQPGSRLVAAGVPEGGNQIRQRRDRRHRVGLRRLPAKRDLLIHRPDFVIVEYAVNDPNTKESAETLEGLVRQILKQPNQPAVVLLFMMSQGGNNAQEWHSKVGTHYGLPMVSFRDGLWPEIKAGRLKWEGVMADAVHPTTSAMSAPRAL